MDNYVNIGAQSILSQNYEDKHDCNGKTDRCSYYIFLKQVKPQYKKLSITYECIDGKLDLGALNIKRNSLFYVTVAFDLTSIVVMILFLWSEIGSESKEEKYFKDKQFLISAFSFQVGPFSTKNWEEELTLFL